MAAQNFYITSECGVLGQGGEAQIVIVSNDMEFKAVADFFQLKEGAGSLKGGRFQSIEW